MRTLAWISLLMFACVLGCAGETKAPPGAEDSDTSLDVDMGGETKSESADDKSGEGESSESP